MKIFLLLFFSFLNIFSFSPSSSYAEAEIYIIPTSIVESPSDNFMFVEDGKKGLKILAVKIGDETELFSSLDQTIAPLNVTTYLGRASLPKNLKNLKVAFIVGYSYSFQEPSSMRCAPAKLSFSKSADGSYLSQIQNSSSNGFSFRIMVNFK